MIVLHVASFKLAIQVNSSCRRTALFARTRGGPLAFALLILGIAEPSHSLPATPRTTYSHVGRYYISV